MFVDLTNQRFGRLIALKFVNKSIRGPLWQCKCDCGGEKIVPKRYLIKNLIKSCGCLRTGPRNKHLEDLKFGKLTVKKRHHKDNKNNVYWYCICECGKEKIARGSHLVSGNITSCGCNAGINMIKLAQKRPPGEAGFMVLYRNIMHGAKKRNLEFNLTTDFVKKLTSLNCHYCNSIPICFRSENSKFMKRYGTYKYNGIDRIDSNIGYIESNCITACKFCNVMKMDLSYNHFLTLIKTIYNNLNLEKINV